MRTRNYKVEITANGQQFVGNAHGCSMATAMHRAISRWRGKTYQGYDDQLNKPIYKKGPAFGTKPKEITVKITRL